MNKGMLKTGTKVQYTGGGKSSLRTGARLKVAGIRGKTSNGYLVVVRRTDGKQTVIASKNLRKVA